jgi:uncharacterized RDD family membrane protein YckC
MSRPLSPYGGTVSRAMAFVLDAALTLLAVSFFVACAGLVHAVFAGAVFGPGRVVSADWVFAAIPAVFGLYCVVCWTLAGRTLGKAALGLRVVDRAGAHPSPVRSIVRFLGYLVSAILLLGFAWIVVDVRHDGFHDKIARTHVVYD